jgi:phenylpyruvate tautomerase PptA (4-oxalocrotonate tautomerase family)
MYIGHTQRASLFKARMQLGGNMPYIDIKIAWNWGTAAQRAQLIERAARMVADVMEKEPIVKSIIVQNSDDDGPVIDVDNSA